MTSELCLMPNNVSYKPAPYLVPMSERSSLSVSSSLEDSNMRRMKNVEASVHHNNLLLNAKYKTESIIDQIKYGSMTIWYLLIAILICVVLFSQTRRV